MAMNRIIRTVAVLSLALIAGCMSQPKKDLAADRLQDQLQTLKEEAQAFDVPPLVVREAERAVRRLDQETGGQALRDHLAYLAERRIDMARAELRRMRDERERARVMDRRAELLVRASHLQAEEARREAERARVMSEASAEDAERARAEAAGARERQREALLRAEQAQAEARQAERVAEAQAEEAKLAREEARLASEQAQALQRRLERMELRQTERGVVVTLGDVLFETGEAELKQGSRSNVLDVVELLQSEPDKKIRVEGHTDSRGSADFNLKLSEERAEAVKDALVAEGIAADRITTVGMGEDFPIADNDTAEGRSQNRRVDVILLDKQNG